MSVRKTKKNKGYKEKKTKKDKSKIVPVKDSLPVPIKKIDRLFYFPLPEWLNRKKIEQLADKHGLTVDFLGEIPMMVIHDVSTIPILNEEIEKNFRLRIGRYYKDLISHSKKLDPVYGFIIDKDAVENFATTFISNLNERLDIRETNKERFKQEILKILDGIIFPEEVEDLANALYDVDKNESIKNLKSFVEKFLLRFQVELLSYLYRRFLTVYHFNYITEDSTKKVDTILNIYGDEIELKEFTFKNVFLSQKYYPHSSKMELGLRDDDGLTIFSFNQSRNNIRGFVAIFSYLFVDSIYIRQNEWLTQKMIKMTTNIHYWERQNISKITNELYDSEIDDIKNIKAEFYGLHQFLLNNIYAMFKYNEDLIYDIRYGSLEMKNFIKSNWIGQPPRWIMQLMPRELLDDLKIINTDLREKVDELERFFTELNSRLQELIELKEYRTESIFWSNLEKAAAVFGNALGGFAKGYGGVIPQISSLNLKEKLGETKLFIKKVTTELILLSQLSSASTVLDKTNIVKFRNKYRKSMKKYTDSLYGKKQKKSYDKGQKRY